MKRLAVLLLLAGCATDDAARTDDAIVGGENDANDPAVVAINLAATGFTVCTGTLIAPDVVLTAGHCPESAIWIRQGSNARSLGWFDHVGVKAGAKHPRFTGEGKPYDVALLQLDRRLDVAPVALSSTPLAESDVGAMVRHVGFGTTGDDWHYVRDIGTGGVKREVTYPITKVDAFFVFSGAPGKQTCIFDSGGPAFRGEQLIAVVSAGADCHSDGWDTRIDRPDILTWIDGVLGLWGTQR